MLLPASPITGNGFTYFPGKRVLANATPAVTATPCTLAAWFWWDIVRHNAAGASSGIHSIIGLINSASSSIRNNFTLWISASQLLATTCSNTALSSATHTLPLFPYRWVHLAAVFASTTSRIPFINGAAGPTDTTSVATPTGINGVILVQTGIQGAGASPPYCAVADIGVWNVALTTAEVLRLAGGAPPSHVNKAGLVHYWPMDERTPRIKDVVGNLNMDQGGVNGNFFPPSISGMQIRIPKFSRRLIT